MTGKIKLMFIPVIVILLLAVSSYSLDITYLVSEWTLDNADMVDGLPGDTMGYNPVTSNISNPIAQQPGIIGECYKFEGDDELIVPDDPSISGKAVMCINFWAKYVTLSEYDYIISKRDEWFFGDNGGSPYDDARWYTIDAVAGEPSVNPIHINAHTGDWYMITGCKNASFIYAFVNGTPMGTPTASTVALADSGYGIDFGFQDQYGVADRHFVGYIDEDTPGFKVLNALKNEPVKINEFEDEILTKCTIEKFNFPSHSTREEILNIIKKYKPKNVVLVHGENDSRDWLGFNILKSLPNSKVYAPGIGSEITL